MDVDWYRAVVTISGDGVFHELLNGILGRKDWQEASKLPIGCISGGSFNAITANLDASHPELATLAIIKGKTRKMDIFCVIQNSTITYSHLFLFWTLIVRVTGIAELIKLG